MTMVDLVRGRGAGRRRWLAVAVLALLFVAAMVTLLGAAEIFVVRLGWEEGGCVAPVLSSEQLAMVATSWALAFVDAVACAEADGLITRRAVRSRGNFRTTLERRVAARLR